MPNVAQLGTIMGIWAHPDDESFMVGGLLSMAAANGQQVICFTATKGEAGQTADESRWPQATLGITREKELQNALDTIGISNHHLFDYGDGNCARVSHEDVVPKIVALINEYNPDTIITFPPDGVTGHPDHRAVSQWARSAATQAKNQPAVYFAVQTQESYDLHLKSLDEKFNVYFATDSPVFIPESQCDVLLKLEGTFAGKKSRALKAQESQFMGMFDFLGDEGVAQALGTEALIKAENDHFWSK